MRPYSILFMPLLVSGMAISSNDGLNCEAQNALMYRKIKAFENNGKKNPYDTIPRCEEAFEKREKSHEKREVYSNKTFPSTEPPSPNDNYRISPMPEFCKKDEYSIGSASELYNLQLECKDVAGTIRFKDYRDAIVDFGGLQTIGGSLYIENISNIVKIQGSKLQRIGHTFTLNSLTSLVSVDMPSLHDLLELDWRVVPILNSASLNKEMKGLRKVTISDTSLSAIDDFNKIKDLDVFDINNNRFLETIKASVQIVRQKLSISANAKQLELEMPLLTSAQNITIRDTSSIFLPKLESVGSSLQLIENDVTSIDMSNLVNVGGTLGIIDNINLDFIDFSNVTEVQGGLIIENNLNLKKIDAFASLKQIGGGIFFDGSFSETNFPQLKLVKGSAYVRSNSEMFDCSRWSTPKNGRSFIRGGKINCISGKNENSESIDTDGNVIDRVDRIDRNGRTSKPGMTADSSSNSDRHGKFPTVSNSNGISNQIPNMLIRTMTTILAITLFV